MHSDIFIELSLVLAVTATIAIVMRLLKQPLIIGYILTGILVGPSVFNFLQEPEIVESLGKFGIALLLFVVGLGLNYQVIKEVGKASVLTGIGQVAFTTIIAFTFVQALGYTGASAIYIAVAMAFSSTIIILKLLNDKKEQNKLYGKISIGFLLVQDVLATVALVLASASGSGSLETSDIVVLILKASMLFAGLWLLTQYFLRPTANFFSRSQELLFLFTIAWGFGVGAIFKQVGFSLEIGALVAGVSMASLHYAQDVASKMRPLRDFFLVVFFIALGATLNLGEVMGVLAVALALSTLVLVGNPIIVMSIMGLLGYTKKTSFKAGLAVAQISEFSIIFVLLGATNGQISSEVVSLVTVVALITIAVSSYMFIYADSLYLYLERYLSLFERRKVKNERTTKRSYEAMIFGYKKGGNEFVKTFNNMKSKFIVVDYDPDVIDSLENRNVDYLYGDANDAELLEELDLSKLKLVVITISDFGTNAYILQLMGRTNPTCVVICHSENIHEAAELYTLGASYVMLPHYIGNEKISAFIKKNGFKKSEYRKFHDKHIEYLRAHFQVDTKQNQ
jgi:Kef-type K+ transport system membrane component KefB